MTEDKLRLEYVPLDMALRWDNNLKRHDIGKLIESFKLHGFKDPAKFEPQLNGGAGGIVEGNGRFEALEAMRRSGEQPPRGVAVSGETWYVPVLFGVDAESEAAAEAYGIDHNALTMSGGDFGITDHLRMWDAEFSELLVNLDAPLATFDGDDLDAIQFRLSHDDEIDFKEFDESIADGVHICECPICGNKHAAKES